MLRVLELKRSKDTFLFVDGAKDRVRTGDPDLGKVMLYQLSYFRLIKKEGSCTRVYQL
jgi:hypothetical protein